MIRIFLFIFFYSMSVFAQDFSAEIEASSSKACYCETGVWPSSQTKLFAIGCEIWLRRQSHCNLKKVILEDTSYLSLQKPVSTQSLNIGYVGHWDDSKHFIDYLANSILPFMRASGNSVFVDNTACDAMNSPEIVSVFLNEQKFGDHQNLTARGNQATSIGTWDVILPSSDNFTAEVSSSVDHVIYPDCSLYEGQSCFESYQKGESGTCSAPGEKKLILTCCQTPGSGFHWEQALNCAAPAPRLE